MRTLQIPKKSIFCMAFWPPFKWNEGYFFFFHFIFSDLLVSCTSWFLLILILKWIVPTLCRWGIRPNNGRFSSRTTKKVYLKTPLGTGRWKKRDITFWRAGCIKMTWDRESGITHRLFPVCLPPFLPSLPTFFLTTVHESFRVDIPTWEMGLLASSSCFILFSLHPGCLNKFLSLLGSLPGLCGPCLSPVPGEEVSHIQRCLSIMSAAGFIESPA